MRKAAIKCPARQVTTLLSPDKHSSLPSDYKDPAHNRRLVWCPQLSIRERRIRSRLEIGYRNLPCVFRIFHPLLVNIVIHCCVGNISRKKQGPSGPVQCIHHNLQICLQWPSSFPKGLTSMYNHTWGNRDISLYEGSFIEYKVCYSKSLRECS